MEHVELSRQQSLRMGELPEDYRVVGIDGREPLVRKPTGQVLRVQPNGRLTAATMVARRRLAERRAGNGSSAHVGPEPGAPAVTRESSVGV